MPPRFRSRVWLSLAVLAVIVLGLASRRYPLLFPTFLGKYPGDALWALMVFLGWAWLLPQAATGRLAGLALVTSYAIEFLQLYQPPWLEAIRATLVGHLVLGSTFSWRDLAAYTVGISLGCGLDLALGLTRKKAVLFPSSPTKNQP